MVYEVRAASVEWNPTTERLRVLAEKMPNSQVTEFGNVVVKARVDSRSTRSTFVVDDSTNATKQTITREEYDRIAAMQDAYIMPAPTWSSWMVTSARTRRSGPGRA